MEKVIIDSNHKNESEIGNKKKTDCSECFAPVQYFNPKNVVLHKDYTIIPKYAELTRTIVEYETDCFESFKKLVSFYCTENTIILFNKDYIKAVFNASLRNKPDYEDSFVKFNFRPHFSGMYLPDNFLTWFSADKQEMIKFIKSISNFIVKPDQASVLKALENIQQIRKITNKENAIETTSYNEVIITSSNNTYRLPTELVLDYSWMDNWDFVMPNFIIDLVYKVGNNDEIIVKMKIRTSQIKMEQEFYSDIAQKLADLQLPVFAVDF